MAKENSNKKQVTTVNSASNLSEPTDSMKKDQAANEDKVNALARLIAKVFKTSNKTAKLIASTIFGILGSVLSIVTIIVALLKGLGVI